MISGLKLGLIHRGLKKTRQPFRDMGFQLQQ